MSSSIDTPTQDQLQTGMIVLGADAALVGEILGIGHETMLIVRRPLPAIRLPIDLVEKIVDGVALLAVTADAADSLGEVEGGLAEQIAATA